MQCSLLLVIRLHMYSTCTCQQEICIFIMLTRKSHQSIKNKFHFMVSCFRKKWQTKREKKNMKKSKFEENNNSKETEALQIDSNLVLIEWSVFPDTKG